MPSTTSTIRLSAVLSATLLLSSTSVLAQRASTTDVAGVKTLVAHSASHAAFIEPAAIQRPAPVQIDEMSEDAPNPAVVQALGCLIAGSVGTGIAGLAGINNVVNVMAGGQVIASSNLALYTAVAGVIFGTFCAVGQALTPLYLVVSRTVPPPAPPPKPPRSIDQKGPIDQKVQFNLEERAATGRVEHSTVGLSNADVDMSVPANWLRPKP